MIQDSKGSEMKESRHEVKTMAKAIEWYPEVKQYQLPLMVHTHKALNGRQYTEVFDSCNNKIFIRG